MYIIKVKQMNPKEHQAWPAFESYSEETGISLEYQEDWQSWWDCFIAGYNEAMKVN